MTEITKTPSEKTIKIPTANYQVAKSASGSISRHNGDPVATAVVGATLEEVYTLAAEVLDTPVADLKAKYEHLNAGQQRMNLGNRMRGVVGKIDRNNELAASKNDPVGLSGAEYMAHVSSSLRDAVNAREEAEAEVKAKKQAAREAAKAEKAAKPKKAKAETAAEA